MFQIHPSSGIPIYRQLVDQTKRLIAAGNLRPGDDLPSVRELAQAHAINPMTVSKAYSQLEIEGVLLRQRGKPMQVAPQPNPQPTSIQSALREPMQHLVSAGRQLQLSDEDILRALEEYLGNPETFNG